jgi:hypothetical protein
LNPNVCIFNFRTCQQDGLVSKEKAVFNDANQLLVYSYNENLLSESSTMMKKNAEALLHAGKEDGLKLNAQKTEHTFTSRQ